MFVAPLLSGARGLHMPALLASSLVLVLLTTQSGAQPTGCPPQIPLTEGQLMYGFPDCGPGTEYTTDIVYNPNIVAGSPRDVLITLRVIHGTGSLNVTILLPQGASPELEPIHDELVSVEDDVQLYRYDNSNAQGAWTIRIETDGSFAKWQLVAFSQPSSVTHDRTERALLQNWANECCVRGADNHLCTRFTNWAAGVIANTTSADDAAPPADDAAPPGGEVEPEEDVGEEDPDEVDVEEEIETADACKFRYNICNDQGRLVRLALDAGNGGFFDACEGAPTALAGFSALRVLHLTYLYVEWGLAGVVEQARKLPQLQELNLNGNELNGTLDMACPLFVGPAPSVAPTLRSFSATGVPLTGPIPPCIFASPSLEYLDLFGTHVTGLLPEIPDGSPLMFLNLSGPVWDEERVLDGAMLSGPIPARWTQAANLRILALGLNNLTGTLPEFPASLEVLSLESNQLAGPIPASLATHSNLKRLHLEDNNLEGPIPAELGSMPMLEELWLMDNRGLSGSIDFPWTNKHLTSIMISDTSVEGPIPASLAKLTQLRQLSISQNPGITSQQAFGEALPAENNLVWYDVSSNSIKDLPEGLKNLAAFTAKRFDSVQYEFPQGEGPIALFDISNNSMQPTEFPAWLLQALPSADLGAQLEAADTAVFNIDDEEDTNKIPCPTKATPLPAYELADQLLQFQPMCTASDGSLVSVAVVVNELEKGNPPKPQSAPAPASSSTARSSSSSSSSSSSLSAYAPQSGGEEKGSGPNLALILGCTAAGVVLAAVLAFVAYKVVAIRKRKAFTSFNGGSTLPTQHKYGTEDDSLFTQAGHQNMGQLPVSGPLSSDGATPRSGRVQA